MPAAILQKPGPLDAQEWEIMRTHAEAGERIPAPRDPHSTMWRCWCAITTSATTAPLCPTGYATSATPPGLVGHHRLRRVRGDDEAAALRRRDHRRRGHRPDPPVLGLAVSPRGRERSSAPSSNSPAGGSVLRPEQRDRTGRHGGALLDAGERLGGAVGSRPPGEQQSPASAGPARWS